jgi:hypothetical protein
MLIENPKYEDYDTIQRKYDGYCIFITHCKGRAIEPEGGIVRARNSDIGELTEEILPMLESDDELGVYTTSVLKDFGDVGVIEVVHSGA